MKEVDLRPIRDCKGSVRGEENKIYFAKSAKKCLKISFWSAIDHFFVGGSVEFFLSLSRLTADVVQPYIVRLDIF